MGTSGIDKIMGSDKVKHYVLVALLIFLIGRLAWLKWYPPFMSRVYDNSMKYEQGKSFDQKLQQSRLQKEELQDQKGKLQKRESTLRQFSKDIRTLYNRLGQPLPEKVHDWRLKTLDFDGAVFNFSIADGKLSSFEITGSSIPLPLGLKIGKTTPNEMLLLFGPPSQKAFTCFEYPEFLMVFNEDESVLQKILSRGNSGCF